MIVYPAAEPAYFLELPMDPPHAEPRQGFWQRAAEVIKTIAKWIFGALMIGFLAFAVASVILISPAFFILPIYLETQSLIIALRIAALTQSIYFLGFLSFPLILTTCRVTHWAARELIERFIEPAM